MNDWTPEAIAGFIAATLRTRRSETFHAHYMGETERASRLAEINALAYDFALCLSAEFPQFDTRWRADFQRSATAD